MAINVAKVNSQAASIVDNVNQLRTAQHQLQTYKNELNNAWQGKEVTYFNSAIDSVMRSIDIVINDMEGILNDIKNTAYQIKREEEQAAAAAAAATAVQKAQRIKTAQNAVDKAKKELDNIKNEINNLEKKMNKNFFERLKNSDYMKELEEKLKIAEKNYNNKLSALRAAKR